VNFENMKLESKPCRVDKPDGFYFVVSNKNHFMSNSLSKEVSDEVTKRFNEYPKFIKIIDDLLYVTKNVYEVCYSKRNEEELGKGQFNIKLFMEHIIEKAESFK